MGNWAVTFLEQYWSEDPKCNIQEICQARFIVNGRMVVLEKGRPVCLDDDDLLAFEIAFKSEKGGFRFDIRPALPFELTGESSMSPEASRYRKLTMEQVDAISDVMDNTWKERHPQPEASYEAASCSLDDVVAVVPSYRVVKLIRQAVESFKAFYPEVPMIVVDDTGQFGPDPATDYIRSLPEVYGNVTPIIHKHNKSHGPSLDDGIRAAVTKYVFTMDSDTIILKGGFLERMRNRAEEKGLFAIGQMLPNGHIHSVASLWNRALYLRTPGAVKHSYIFVCMFDYVHRHLDKFPIEDFPIHEEYAMHIGSGTRNMFESPYGWWDPSSPGAQAIWVGQQPRRDIPELQ